MRDHSFFSHESPTTGYLEDRTDRAGYLALALTLGLLLGPALRRRLSARGQRGRK